MTTFDPGMLCGWGVLTSLSGWGEVVDARGV